MSGDSLFPFPEPDFLFVHDVYLFNIGAQNPQLDERGKRTVSLPQKVNGEWPQPPVRGYLTAGDAQQDQTGYMLREGIDAVLLLPNGTGIDQGWIIECHDPQLPPHLAGTYDVNLTRPNISHTRVLVKRYRNQWGRWPGGA